MNMCICIRVYIYMDVWACVYALYGLNVCIYMNTHTHTHTQSYTHTHKYTQTHAHTHVHTTHAHIHNAHNIHRYIYAYTRIHTYIHMYVHISDQKCAWEEGSTCICTFVYIYRVYVSLTGIRLLRRRSDHMGCLRLVGSLKFQVSFAKEPYKRDDILQKRPVMIPVKG